MESERLFRCALITGASSGLGEEYARQLAPLCDQLVFVARRKDILDSLIGELVQEYSHTGFHAIACDLSKEEDREQLFKSLKSLEMVPDLLVNNAGLGDYGAFESADWRKLDSMLQVNVTALTHMCHGLLPGMMAQEKGAIINVSSLASTLPIPDFAVYAATKAYVTSFSEALRLELRDYSIPVLAVCPGPVHTGFGKVAMRDDDSSALPSREGFYVTKEKVVLDSIQALLADKARVFPGWKIALLAGVISVLPMAVVRMISMRRR